MRETKSYQVVLLDACQLSDDTQHRHLGHDMRLLVFLVVDRHQHTQEVELGEELVDCRANGLE